MLPKEVIYEKFNKGSKRENKIEAKRKYRFIAKNVSLPIKIHQTRYNTPRQIKERTR
jgi:hypothetical protein